MYSQKWTCYFQNKIVMFCLPVPTLIYLWEIYIFPGSFCLFCCREICGLMLVNKSLTDTWMWKLVLRLAIPRKGIQKWDFPCSVTLVHNHSLFWLYLCIYRLTVPSSCYPLPYIFFVDTRGFVGSCAWPAFGQASGNLIKAVGPTLSQ
jgi:hypothetical protein